jgi:starch-binding outer membrane protein, SusD/RagB family
MKSIKLTIVVLALVCGLASCNDWLKEQQPNESKLSDFFISKDAAKQAVVGCYVPMTWNLGSTYCNEWLIGDVASDDAIKGGEYLKDMADAFDICKFQVVSSNGLLDAFYNAQYIGISRCNQALESIAAMILPEDMTETERSQMLGEARFLRAFYYFRLVRLFGGVPMPLAPVVSSEDWKMQRSTSEEVYAQIISDLEAAEAVLPLRSEYAADDLGRVTKGAAEALLMKVNLYLKNYSEVLKWGKLITASDEYSLVPDYFSQFLLENEWSAESVFEINYVTDMYSDYGGFGFTRGTFTQIMMRPRSANVGGVSGWGYDRPTWDLYAEFEDGDPRRGWTILVQLPSEVENETAEIHYANYFYNRKYQMETYPESAEATAKGLRFEFPDLSHASRAGLNWKEIRYADVLLMYAEAAIESGTDFATAKEYINSIRHRASASLPEVEATREALRHERRVELAMEGHRWFDLCRWGIAKETMNAYRQKFRLSNWDALVSEYPFIASIDKSHFELLDGDDMCEFQDYHVLMPIPQEQIRLAGLQQNEGY